MEYRLSKGKSLEKNRKVNDLSNIINDCIQIDKNINNINVITKRINQCNLNLMLKFFYLMKTILILY